MVQRIDFITFRFLDYNLFTAVPSDSELVDLSHDICSIWKNIGFRLGLPTATLDNIAGTPGLDTPQKKALEMLTKWHQGQTTSSRGALCAVLRKEGRTDLADKYSIHQQVRNTVWCIGTPCLMLKALFVFMMGLRTKCLHAYLMHSGPSFEFHPSNIWYFLAGEW